MFKQVKLVTHGEPVAYVTIPGFDNAPDILAWGTRFFARSAKGVVAVEDGMEFEEVFCVAVTPIPGVAKNDGTDPEEY